MLLAHYSTQRPEAGCDEAGRGCLAAAVVLPEGYANARLNDSKQLTPAWRYRLREEILRDAVAWAVGTVSASEIDEINILNASILAMHRALDGLKVRPAFRSMAIALSLMVRRLLPRLLKAMPNICPSRPQVFWPKPFATTRCAVCTSNILGMAGIIMQVILRENTAAGLSNTV